MILISDDKINSKEIEEYEKETGKKAIWRGIVTEGFKKWKSGEKIYSREKERVALYLSDEDKGRWQEFGDKTATTLSNLIRNAVEFFIVMSDRIPDLQAFTKISHDLKEPLTIIKGYTQLMIENYKDKIDSEILFNLKEILERSNILERRITETFEFEKKEKFDYDILIIDDDVATIKVLTQYFGFRGINSKGISSGIQVLEEIKKYSPKVILLDIIMPEVDGYELCKKIKQDVTLNDIYIFFITAIPGFEVEKKISETGATGYFLKPFNFTLFNKLDSFFKKSHDRL